MSLKNGIISTCSFWTKKTTGCVLLEYRTWSWDSEVIFGHKNSLRVNKLGGEIRLNQGFKTNFKKLPPKICRLPYRFAMFWMSSLFPKDSSELAGLLACYIVLFRDPVFSYFLHIWSYWGKFLVVISWLAVYWCHSFFLFCCIEGFLPPFSLLDLWAY